MKHHDRNGSAKNWTPNQRKWDWRVLMAQEYGSRRLGLRAALAGFSIRVPVRTGYDKVFEQLFKKQERFHLVVFDLAYLSREEERLDMLELFQEVLSAGCDLVPGILLICTNDASEEAYWKIYDRYRTSEDVRPGSPRAQKVKIVQVHGHIEHYVLVPYAIAKWFNRT